MDSAKQILKSRVLELRRDRSAFSISAFCSAETLMHLIFFRMVVLSIYALLSKSTPEPFFLESKENIKLSLLSLV